MYRFELYHKHGTFYVSRTGELSQLLDAIRVRWDAQYSVVEADSLTETDKSRLLNEIRGIPPQARGKIVTSRSNILPVSGAKKLNLDNTPILVLRQDGNAVNVYPHMLGTTYFDVESSLKKILEVGPDQHMMARGLLEEPLLKILADHPTIIESGLSFVKARVVVPAGEIDLLLRDRLGRIIVVETETHATDFAVGQVSRLAHSYGESSQTQSDLRKFIVCISSDPNLAGACESAGVELFRLAFNKLA